LIPTNSPHRGVFYLKNRKEKVKMNEMYEMRPNNIAFFGARLPRAIARASYNIIIGDRLAIARIHRQAAQKAQVGKAVLATELSSDIPPPTLSVAPKPRIIEDAELKSAGTPSDIPHYADVAA
jgi:hypothetical protein